MLRLNPGDNQGVRYTLTSWLLNLDRDEDLAKLLKTYDEPTTTTVYSKALLTYRREGDTPASQKLLKAAVKWNKHVPDYLLGEEELPQPLPSSYSVGDEDDAILYVASALSAWRSTPGAMAWVRDALKPKKRRTIPEAKSFAPSAQSLERLTRLPQTFDQWQAGWRQLPIWIEEGGEGVQPWAVIVASMSSGMLLNTTIVAHEPTPEQLWDLLAAPMQKPPKVKPHRPTTLLVQPDPRWDELRPHLDAVGVACETLTESDLLDDIFQSLAEHLGEDMPPGLLEVPGMTPERVASFYHAAAEFYRQAPWRRLGYEEAIRVECSQFESGPWYAVVMGQSGMTLGVALYENLTLLKKLWAGKLSDEENARRTVALAVTFDPATDTNPKDVASAREHGWEIASPEAYPSVYRKERGMSMRPPLAWELELLEGCLREIPRFIAQHKPGDTTKSSVTVPVASGNLDLVLSWVDAG